MDAEDIAKANALAQIQAGANPAQVQQLITEAQKLDNDDDDDNDNDDLEDIAKANALAQIQAGGANASQVAKIISNVDRLDNDRDDNNDDLDDIAEANALAQIAAGANASQIQSIINNAHRFDDDHDNDDGIFDDDWLSIAALAASGQLNGVASNASNAALSFINATMPTNARAQALYTNVTNALQQQLQAAKRSV